MDVSIPDLAIFATGEGDTDGSWSFRATGDQEAETWRLFWGESLAQVNRTTSNHTRWLDCLLEIEHDYAYCLYLVLTSSFEEDGCSVEF